MQNFFRYPNFSQTPKGSPKDFFGTVKRNIFHWKRCYLLPSLIPNVFGHPKLAKHFRGPMQKISALWDRKFAAENCDAPSISGPTLLSLTFFDSENFLQTQNGSSTKCFGSVNSTSSMENLDNSPLSYTYDFSISRLFRAEKSSSTKCFGSVKQTISMENRDASPLSHS